MQKKIITILLAGVFIFIFISVILSWLVAGYLTNIPLNDRYDPCQQDSIQFCPEKMLELFNLQKIKIDVSITSTDGIPLKGYYFPSQNGAAIIVQHGYRGQKGNVMHIANALYQQGYGVITMDLRAHGQSGGELATFGRDESKDMQLVFDYLANREEINAEKIGLYGWSLGGATVLLAGSKIPQVKAVIADSPFDAINLQNLTELTDAIWPIPSMILYFTELKTQIDFQQEAPINHLDAYKKTPLLLLIAGADQVVDPKSGERLLKKLNNPKIEAWLEPSFGHVRFSFEAPKKFKQKVTAFFAKHLQPNQFKAKTKPLNSSSEDKDLPYQSKYEALFQCFPHC